MNMEDKIIQKLIEMDQKIDEMKTELVTKTELFGLENRLNTTLDAQGVILQRLDQERLFTMERIKRIELDVERMKQVLHII